jgi:hypothetical protein
MLILFPALLTNCGHTRCLSHVGTEGSSQKDEECSDVDRITAQHLIEIEQKISDLKRLAKELRRLNNCCQGNGIIADCRILEALSPSRKAEH